MVLSWHMLQAFISFGEEEEAAWACKTLNMLWRKIFFMSVILIQLENKMIWWEETENQQRNPISFHVFPFLSTSVAIFSLLDSQLPHVCLFPSYALQLVRHKKNGQTSTSTSISASRNTVLQFYLFFGLFFLLLSPWRIFRTAFCFLQNYSPFLPHQNNSTLMPAARGSAFDQTCL